MNLPDKKYQIILADPAWQYDDKLKHHGGSADSHYNTLTIDQICSINIQKITDENCFLFLWGTWALLTQVLKVMGAWGFNYKTSAFVWLKTYKTGRDVFGMGNYTRGNTEYCLLGVNGKPKRQSKFVSQLIKTTIREHSKKPDIVRDKILQLCGDLPRIELFARTKVHGWDVWGNDPKLESKPLEAFT